MEPLKTCALLLLSLFSTLAIANEPACLRDLEGLIGGSVSLVETNPGDGCPLTITLSGFDVRTATVTAGSSKPCGGWEILNQAPRRRNISNCRGRSGSIRFNVLGRTISQRGGMWQEGPRIYSPH